MSDKLFKPRTEAPSSSNKNWIHYSNNGYNYCIEIKNGSCLPNCVGYAWGRWRELLGKKHKLSVNQAEIWYTNTSDGYKRGKTPKLGAVICWSKGSAKDYTDGEGHVMIVEKINSDGSILASGSDAGGSRFYTRKFTKSFSLGSKYKFQGFIYPPIDFVKELPKEEPIEIKEEPKQEEPTITPIEPKVEEYKLKKEITKDGYYKIKLYNGETLIIK